MENKLLSRVGAVNKPTTFIVAAPKYREAFGDGTESSAKVWVKKYAEYLPKDIVLSCSYDNLGYPSYDEAYEGKPELFIKVKLVKDWLDKMKLFLQNNEEWFDEITNRLRPINQWIECLEDEELQDQYIGSLLSYMAEKEHGDYSLKIYTDMAHLNDAYVEIINGGTCVARCTKPHQLAGLYIVPKGVTEIAYRAFYGCENLKNIILPHSLTKIGTEAFANSGLEEIRLDPNIQYIGDRAFRHCHDLAHARVHHDVIPRIGADVFDECMKLRN